MSGEWTNHPKLQGKFHPDFPDDLQVIVHDGQPVMTGRGAELMWVHVTACKPDVPIFGKAYLAVFRGVILNKPEHLQSVCEGGEILFVAPEGGDHPLHVTQEYLEERPFWRMLAPCRKCGLSELYAPPSILVRHSFPDVPEEQVSAGFTFTSKCGWCGDPQLVRLMRRRAQVESHPRVALESLNADSWSDIAALTDEQVMEGGVSSSQYEPEPLEYFPTFNPVVYYDFSKYSMDNCKMPDCSQSAYCPPPCR